MGGPPHSGAGVEVGWIVGVDKFVSSVEDTTVGVSKAEEDGDVCAMAASNACVAVESGLVGV